MINLIARKKIEVKVGDKLYNKYNGQVITILQIKDQHLITDGIDSQYPYGIAIKINEVGDTWRADFVKLCNEKIRKNEDIIKRLNEEIDTMKGGIEEYQS